MKKNITKPNNHWGLVATICLVAGMAVIAGLFVGYDKLHDIYLEQCVINDTAVQVSITSGKMVKSDVLAEEFGIRTGANLAQIDFEDRRVKILKKIPNLRSISITRQLPDKVRIIAEERVPVARINIKGQKTETGRVVDTEGIVFTWQRNTQSLPIIREPSVPGTAVGKRLGNRELAALRLIEANFEPQYSELGILEVDVSKPDYLLATLGNYSSAKIAWEGMDTPTPASHQSLNRQLSMLVKAIRSRLGENAVIWDATDTESRPGRIYADTKGNL